MPPYAAHGHRGRPPLVLLSLLLSTSLWPPPAHTSRAVSADLPLIAPGSGQASLRALLRDPRQQGANLCLPVPTVTTERADGRQLAGLSPSSDGFRVHPEHGRDLCRCQQRLGLWCACRHVYGLSSWTGTAILRFVAVPGSVGEPAVDVPYGLLTDHIAITSRDKSTTRSKVSVTSYPVAPLI